jgi:hypothetical protein
MTRRRMSIERQIPVIAPLTLPSPVLAPLKSPASG